MTEVEKVTSRFVYDAETGNLIWNTRPLQDFCNESSMKSWHTRFFGKIAGAKNKNGYIHVGIFGKLIPAHRIVWAIHTGSWPRQILDHIDGERTNNRFQNLREASFIQNGSNAAKSKSNKSGLKGVCFHKKEKLWRSQICVNRKKMYLGAFDCKAAAYFSYVVASDKFHGEFGRVC